MTVIKHGGNLKINLIGIHVYKCIKYKYMSIFVCKDKYPWGAHRSSSFEACDYFLDSNYWLLSEGSLHFPQRT